ncbi:MAG: methyltransferase domain-containing protein [Candidatus Moranbacteria bacterium]|nr:methyltransferase domain-containing protein [Candidatus Moranbacteria bacterium]
MNNKLINTILQETENGYDRMAEKLSGTRNFFWPDLAFIGEHISEGARVLDFGCGNGRLLEILRDKKPEYYGVDVSQKLIDLAKVRYPEFSRNFTKISGQASLPFPDDFFNNIVSIAVFHHFPDKKFRSDMARELYRVTRPGGEVIVTAWNLWQPRYRRYIWKNMVRKVFLFSRLDFGDCEIPFRNNAGEIFRRFHHAYTLNELAGLFSQAGFRIEAAKVVNDKNLVVIARK